MTAQSPRVRAYLDLERVEKKGAYAGLSRRAAGSTSPGERGITDLVSGVTRWRRWLDFLVDSFYRGEPEELEFGARLVIRMGLYELLRTNAADHAALNETVETAKKVVGKRVSGLVNGVLRTALRRREDLPVPDTGDRVHDLAVLHSHPSWMAGRWIERYGEPRAVELMEHNNARPRFGLRVRSGGAQALQERLATESPGESVIEMSPWFDDFLRAARLTPVFRSGALEKGHVLVQDEAAGLVVKLMEAKPGERVLDACAAPGGKALYLSELVGTHGVVAAVDRSRSRLGLLDREVDRLGAGNVKTTVSDFTARSPDEFGGSFDRVLLDAPCSGLGVLAKRADLRWRKTEDDVEQLARLQGRLLEHAAEFVKPGGLLVYGTCTIEPEENELQVHDFLSRRSDFALERCDRADTEPFADEDGFYRSLPFLHGMDGSFAARLRKRAD